MINVGESDGFTSADVRAGKPEGGRDSGQRSRLFIALSQELPVFGLRDVEKGCVCGRGDVKEGSKG